MCTRLTANRIDTDFNEIAQYLIAKADWVRKETIKIHLLAPETRLASSLSCVEILTVLFYGQIIVRDHKEDYFIPSKAHGTISLYPILADLGYISFQELKKVCNNGSLLGAIPDPNIPWYRTLNGSLGQGLGLGCGIAYGLKAKNDTRKIFVLIGDGELNEGSMWEAIMFAGHHELSNLIVILDKNKTSMLDRCQNILHLDPIEDKFKVFNWLTRVVNGHNVMELYYSLKDFRSVKTSKPKILIANTIKGKGIPLLENDPQSHIRTITTKELNNIMG